MKQYARGFLAFLMALGAVTASLNGAVAATDPGAESARIVSQHRAVFTKAPRGANGYSTNPHPFRPR